MSVSAVSGVPAPGTAAPGSAAAGAAPAPDPRIDELAARDREVRAHENAHRAAAGPYARGVSFGFTVGPDGRRYATSGEVSIDSSPVAGDPRATIQKAQVIRRAALAPAEPSAQDLGIASQAARMAAEARRELAAEAGDETETGPGARSRAALEAYEKSEPELYAVDRSG